MFSYVFINLKKFDKIIVIDNGNLVKFDIPEKLIRNNDEILNVNNKISAIEIPLVYPTSAEEINAARAANIRGVAILIVSAKKAAISIVIYFTSLFSSIRFFSCSSFFTVL